MTYMLVRNRVTDFAQWMSVVESHAEARETAGLRLVNLWRSVEDPNNIFFLLEVASIEKAEEFVNHPDSAKAKEESGVIDGEYHYVNDAL
jgi:hypothetical protein